MNTAGTLLIKRDPGFLGLVERWRLDKVPFPGHADWFTEKGMPGQAAGWTWAANNKKCPYEYTGDSSKFHLWTRFIAYLLDDGHLNEVPYSVPTQLFPTGRHLHAFPRFPEAVAWFLDRWAEVFGEDADPDLMPKINTEPWAHLPRMNPDGSFSNSWDESDRTRYMVRMEIPVSPNFRPGRMLVASTE